MNRIDKLTEATILALQGKLVESYDDTYIKKYPELEAKYDELFEICKNKIETGLGIRLKDNSVSKYTKFSGSCDIKISDNKYVTVRLSYVLPDGIYNYIYLLWSADVTTVSNKPGNIAGINYSSHSSTQDLYSGTISTYRTDQYDENALNNVENDKYVTIDEFVTKVKEYINKNNM